MGNPTRDGLDAEVPADVGAKTLPYVEAVVVAEHGSIDEVGGDLGDWETA